MLVINFHFEKYYLLCHLSAAPQEVKNIKNMKRNMKTLSTSSDGIVSVVPGFSSDQLSVIYSSDAGSKMNGLVVLPVSAPIGVGILPNGAQLFFANGHPLTLPECEL